MIQTVTGAIDPKLFGAILMHEHISCSSLSFNRVFGDTWLDESSLENLACDTLILTNKKYNLGLMVDGTPIDLGRNVKLLKKVSERSGVKIVASTGFYYLQSIETFNNNAENLAKWIIYECQHGMDGTDIKPGILKCATGSLGLTDDNLKKLAVMGIVQNETKLPLYVHSEHYDDIAFKQIDLLTKSSARAEKIIIGHTAIRPDVEYLKRLLNTGCYICMDQCHCYADRKSNIADTLVKLCQMGYADKILLSNDYCIHSDFCNMEINGMHLNAEEHTNGLGYILDKQYKEFMLQCGLQKDWDRMINKNPIDILNVD